MKALVAVAEAAERSNDAFFHGPAANSHAYALRDALDALAAALSEADAPKDKAVLGKNAADGQ